jgi:hypothetical protein
MKGDGLLLVDVLQDVEDSELARGNSNRLFRPTGKLTR